MQLVWSQIRILIDSFECRMEKTASSLAMSTILNLTFHKKQYYTFLHYKIYFPVKLWNKCQYNIALKILKKPCNTAMYYTKTVLLSRLLNQPLSSLTLQRDNCKFLIGPIAQFVSPLMWHYTLKYIFKWGLLVVHWH